MMESGPSIWEQVFLAVLAIALVFLFRPGIKKALAESKQAENKDWAAALWPIALVVLFVVFLVMVT